MQVSAFSSQTNCTWNLVNSQDLRHHVALNSGLARLCEQYKIINKYTQLCVSTEMLVIIFKIQL